MKREIGSLGWQGQNRHSCKSNEPRRTRLWVLLSCFVSLVGCQETVSFNVVKAAQVNVRGMTAEGHDPTVSIGKWGGVDQSAAADIAQRIRELITNSPGGVVKFAETGGVVQLDGNVGEYKYDETVTTKQSTCSRYDKDTKKHEKYPCTLYTREGTARVSVSLNVIDSTGKTVGSHTFSGNVPKRETATDGQPEPIDWESTMQGLRASAAAELANLVVPTPIVVTKPWFKCGDANEQCKAGLVQLRQGNFEPAQALFRRALDLLKAAPKQDADALGAAWWALALSQEFSSDYAGANASLTEAINLDPGNETYAAEVKSISDLRKNQERLGKQGVGTE